MQLTHLGPYVIDKPLGKGGMGFVYAATDPQTGQRVAIKALTPHLAAAEGFRERFEAEIESLKTLRHDGIVRLYGYGEQDGILFYSMELVEGISLEDELKAGRRFNWREVTNIAIQLSLALKHAHDHGIIHRDIKPANILLYNDEHVKLADFGIARLFGTTSLTTAGGVLGTADYMSPEQADGRPVTARCDQYSLGGVMYALLAGRPPFRAKNLPQMLQMQRFANPEPVRRYAPDTPEQLEQVIMQLLSKEPSARFPNTQVLARHLQAMVNALSRPAADDFALAADPLPDSNPFGSLHESISTEVTQPEVVPSRGPDARPLSGGASRTINAQASQNAITLAAEELDNCKALRDAAVAPPSAAQLPQEPVSHFTTVEEEEARIRNQARRSWVLAATQLIGLVTFLAALTGIAWYVFQPPSADKLFATIDSRVDGTDDASLVRVEKEIKDFLSRFPDDPRAELLLSYQERIDLDKLERRLQRVPRSGAVDAPLIPVEQLYLRAVTLAPTSPDDAVAVLQSLIDLYGPAGLTATADSATGAPTSDSDIDSKRRTADIVQLAIRRMKSMQPDIDRRRQQEISALQERLIAAGALAKSNPVQAKAMYHAIVELYADDNWAKDIVETARAQLAKLESKQP